MVGSAGAQDVSTESAPPGGDVMVGRDGASLPTARSSTSVLNGSPGAATITAATNPFPPHGSGDVGGASVIGPDGRFKTNALNAPASFEGIVFSTFGDNSVAFCTGFMLGDNTVVTAAHCLWQPGLGYASLGKAVYFPAALPAGPPLGSCRDTLPPDVKVHQQWINTRNENYDYGYIKLHVCDYGPYSNGNIGLLTGTYGANVQSGMVGKLERVSGYASNRSPFGQQWKSKGAIKAATNTLLFYKNDTSPMEAGAPVYPPGVACTTRCVIGINARGLHGTGDHALYNHGVRVNQSVFNNLAQAVALP